MIQETAITATYKPIEGLKRLYNERSALLESFFNEATILPIPDQGPPEIPRIVITTKNEHSQLNISPIAATFVSRYDAGYEKNWQLCAEHFSERMKTVFEFLNHLTQNSYEYTGLVTKVIYDEVKQAGVKKISDVLLKADKISDIHDINVRYTFINEQKYFVNIMFQNIRAFDDELGVLNQKGRNIENQKSETIGFILDINDKYALNNQSNYRSDSNTLKHLSKITDDFLNNRISSFIERGEYKYEE